MFSKLTLKGGVFGFRRFRSERQDERADFGKNIPQQTASLAVPPNRVGSTFSFQRWCGRELLNRYAEAALRR
jgi:hypothetical protein